MATMRALVSPPLTTCRPSPSRRGSSTGGGVGAVSNHHHGGIVSINKKTTLAGGKTLEEEEKRGAPFAGALVAATLTAAATAAAAFSSPSSFAAAADTTYTGVGLEIFVGPDKRPAVVEFLGPSGGKNGPAFDAGVKLNDKLLEVDGKSTAEMGGLRGVAAALRGGGDGGEGEGARGTENVEVVVARKGSKGGAKVTEEKLVIRRGSVAPNPRSCFVASCARV